MAKYCSKCGKNLSILSTKHRSEDGSVICGSCFEKWKEEQKRKNREIMEGYISKYLQKKGWRVDLEDLFDGYQGMEISEVAEDALKLNTVGIIRDAPWFDLGDWLGIEDFDEDLEKMQKLFYKKGINTDEDEIISVFANVVREQIHKKVDEEITPAYELIAKSSANNPTMKDIVKEFIKMPLYDNSNQLINILRISVMS